MILHFIFRLVKARRNELCIKKNTKIQPQLCCILVQQGQMYTGYDFLVIRINCLSEHSQNLFKETSAHLSNTKKKLYNQIYQKFMQMYNCFQFRPCQNCPHHKSSHYTEHHTKSFKLCWQKMWVPTLLDSFEKLTPVKQVKPLQ